MSNQKPGSLNEGAHYSIDDELAKIEGAHGQEGLNGKPQEGPWPRQKPARPDAIDIGRTFAVTAVGVLVGVVVVIIVFVLLK